MTGLGTRASLGSREPAATDQGQARAGEPWGTGLCCSRDREPPSPMESPWKLRLETPPRPQFPFRTEVLMAQPLTAEPRCDPAPLWSEDEWIEKGAFLPRSATLP